MNFSISKMAGLNISLNISFSRSAIVLLCCRRSTVFFIDSERNETVSLNFPAGFSLLFSRKTSSRMSLVNVCEAALQGASAYERREFWRETLFGLSLEVSFFSHVKKHRSRFLWDVSFF